MAFSNQYNFNTVAEAEANWIFTDPIGTGLQATAVNSRWTWSNTTTPSGTNTVGPTNGQGGANDGYVYTEASGNPAPSGLEFFAEVDQNFDASTNDIVFSFYRNQTGPDNECTFRVQSREDGGVWTDRGQVFGGPGQQTDGTTWVQHTVDMTGLISSLNTRFRIVITTGTTGNVWNNDGAIDTVSIVGTDIVVLGGEAKYINTLTQVSTNSIISTGFTASHYSDARIVGVWSSSGDYKGMSWIRRFVSTTELELDFPLIDEDGNTVIQEVGDLFQISLNFADLDNTIAIVTGKTVQILQPIEFGTLNDSYSICFYDEAKDVRVTSNLGSYPMRFNGGLIVFGHLYDYDTRRFSNSVNFTSTDDGANGNQLVVFSESTKVWWLGGSLLFQVTPARFPGGGAAGSTAAEWQKWWGISTNADIVSPGGGAPWSNNAESQEFINIDSNPNSNNAIGFRIADGTLLGGSVKISSDNVISPFGADANGDYIIGAEPNERFNVSDIGWNNTKTTFWRSSQARNQTIRANNIITSDRRSGTGVNPGSNPLNTAVISFYYSDSYTNVLENTKFSILRSDNSLENTYLADSSGVINGEVLEATVTGFTENVVDNNWSYNLYLYGYSFISGVFSTTTVRTLSGTAKNVELGGLINQVEDSEITVDLITARSIDTQENTIRTYDSVLAVFYDNFLTQKRIPVIKTGETLNFINNDIIITTNTGSPIINGNTITLNVGSLGEYTGNILTTGVVDEGNVQVLGSITDSNGFRSNKVITLTGIANPSKVHLFNAGLTPTDLDYEIDTQLVTNGTYSFVFKAGQNITADVRVNNLQNRIIEFNVLLGLNDINIPISQQTDRIYENN